MFFEAKTEQDFSVIEKLAEEIWTEHYTPIIGKNQIEYMLKKFNSAKYMSKQAESTNCPYFILTDNNRPIGYIAFEFRSNDLFLNKFYIRLAERGKSFGRKAMEFIENKAKLKD